MKIGQSGHVACSIKKCIRVTQKEFQNSKKNGNVIVGVREYRKEGVTKGGSKEEREARGVRKEGRE